MKKKTVIRSKLQNDWQEVMETPAGRRVIWNIMVNAKTFGVSFDENPYRTAYNEGKRAVGSEIYSSLMLYCPERFLQAQNEFNSSIKQKQDELNKKAEESSAER